MTCSFIGNLFSIRVIFWTTEDFASLFLAFEKGKVVTSQHVSELCNWIERDLLHAKTTFPPQTCPVGRLASLHWPLKKSIRRPTLRRLETTRTCWPAFALMEYKLIGRSFVFCMNRSGIHPRLSFFIAICCVSITFHHWNTSQRRAHEYSKLHTDLLLLFPIGEK